MYSPFQLGIRYLKYYVSASNGKGHGVHSPFVFSFITRVLNDDRHFYAYQSVEILRQLLLNDHQLVEIEEFDLQTGIKKNNSRKICEIASSSLNPKKVDQLLFRIVDHYAPKHILGLGTSFGISTSYLASARQNSIVVAIVNTSALAKVARKNFQKLQLQNIELIEGNFDDAFTSTLQKMKTIDLAFVDGIHQYELIIHYFKNILPAMHESSVLIINHIHKSEEMEQAWEEIKQHSSVTLTIDLFFIGLVFFRKEQKVKQDFVIRY